MVRSKVIVSIGLIPLCFSLHSSQTEAVSYNELRSACLNGMSAAIVLELSSCKLVDSNHQAGYGSDYLTATRFNIDRATVRGIEGSDQIIITDSAKLPHTPKMNDTTIGPLYDVSEDLVMYSSGQVYFYLKAQQEVHKELINSIYDCPWSALTINITK